jgi:hypothetical protein
MQDHTPEWCGRCGHNYRGSWSAHNKKCPFGIPPTGYEPRWRTVSVTALAAPLRVTVSSCGEMSSELAIAMLLQRNGVKGDVQARERVVLGCLNQQRGEIEALEAEDDGECFGVFVGLEDDSHTNGHHVDTVGLALTT